jgi:cytochrome c oxidase subunit 2
VSPFATHIVASTDFGSPPGVTAQNTHVIFLWQLTYWMAIPLGLLVIGLILWCAVRYRVRPGSTRRASQFQYQIPLEVTYVIIPLIMVAVVFGFMYSAENKIDHVSKAPAVKIEVQAFQWGWRFIYPNGHQEVGSVSNNLQIDSYQNLPVLYMPEHETVQMKLVTEDVIHTFYIPAFLFQRDMIQGINNVVDFNADRTGVFDGECNNICGVYHAYMRFKVDVMTVPQYNAWYAQQPPGSIHNW